MGERPAASGRGAAWAMPRHFGMARKVDELPIYSKATAFSSAVIALLQKAPFGRDRKLREQISDAMDSITANMCEGFEQPTDRAFQKYLFDSKGSLGEVL